MVIRKVVVTAFTAIALVCASSWAATASHLDALQAQQQPDTQSATGKVLTVADSTFSLEVQNGDDPQRIEFVTDKNTKIEGKLQIGSTASVDYRTEDNRNVAVRVVVTNGQ
jgi:hypothetical protein